MNDPYKIKKHTLFIPDKVYRKTVRALIKSVMESQKPPFGEPAPSREMPKYD